MKKIISMFFTMLLMFSLTACEINKVDSGDSVDNQQSDSEIQSSEPSIENPDNTHKKLGTFNKNVTLDEIVMLDKDGIKITATGLNYTDYSAELELIIENNTEKNLSFISGSYGYKCNSVNGYMMSNAYLSCNVAAGKKAIDSVSFDYDELMIYGITEIADVEIGFDIGDDNYNHTYIDPIQLKTSAFDSHDYSVDCYQTAITNSATMNAYGYDIKYFSKDAFYDENGVKLVSSCFVVNDYGETMLLLELENTTGNSVHVRTSDVSLNGLLSYGSDWSDDTINPGKRGIIDVNLSYSLEKEYWSVYGINELSSVSIALTQQNSEGTNITDKVYVEIVIPDVAATFDSSGKEIYNNNGLRIVAKTILEDSYGSDMNILLLAENNSGKTLQIDDVYDSLSINGFMTDYSCYCNEIKNGESAALKIELWESSLKSNKINAVSDIKEVEISFEITQGRNNFDKPTVKILFE